MSRRRAAVAVLAILGGVVAGCGCGGDFTRESGIKTKLVPVPEDQLTTLITNAAAGGTLPDVMLATPLGESHTYAQQGIFDAEAAQDVVERLGRDTFSGQALDLVSRDGVATGVPSDGWGQLVIYRRDLFEQAGLDAPRTIDDIRTAAEALVEFMLSGDAYVRWLGLSPQGKYPVRLGDAREPQRYVDAWAELESGVDRKAPLSEVYSEESIAALGEGVKRFQRWGFPQDQGALVGALSGAQPIADAVARVVGGGDPARGGGGPGAHRGDPGRARVSAAGRLGGRSATLEGGEREASVDPRAGLTLRPALHSRDAQDERISR